MSLAKLFYMKETFRASVRRWRQACFRKQSHARREQRFTLEALEPRLLLDASPLLVNMEALGQELTVQVQNEGATSTVVILDTATATVVASRNLADTSEINFVGSDANDALTIDQTAAMSGLAITFAGGAGSDTLVGADVDTTWTLSGFDSGDVGGIAFAGVENLVGGLADDTFVVQRGAGLSGSLEGGAGGFDTLSIDGAFARIEFAVSGPNSGSIDLDGRRIAYTGLEPITNPLPAAEIVYNASPSTLGVEIKLLDAPAAGQLTIQAIDIETGMVASELHTFASPTSRLTIRGSDHDDRIVLDSIDPAFTADITVEGGKGNDTFVVTLDPAVANPVNGVTVELFGEEGVDILHDLTGIAVGFLHGIEVDAEGLPEWLEQGPGLVMGGGRGSEPNAGAIESIAVHPFNQNIIYVGSVNGGVWLSQDAGVSWSPLTDQLLSLSIGSVVVASRDADGEVLAANYHGTGNPTPRSKLVLYAGTGSFSSFGDRGGLSLGLLKSSDGGTSWEQLTPALLLGVSITSIVVLDNGSADPNAQIVLVSAMDKVVRGKVAREGGVFRSTNSGRTFERVEGEGILGLDLSGSATDLDADPGHPGRAYAAFVKKPSNLFDPGIYRTDDYGVTWREINGSTLQLTGDQLDNDGNGSLDDGEEKATGADRILLAVRANPAPTAATGPNPVYAALIGDKGQLMGVFSSTPDAAGSGHGSWSLLGSAPPLASASVKGTPTITLADGGNPLAIRRDTGDWRKDGFFPGQDLTISGASVAGNNGTFRIAAVSEQVLTLVAGSVLAAEPAGSTPSLAAAAPTDLNSVRQPQVNLGEQGETHFSLAADAAGNVFMGGDSRNDRVGIGNLYFWNGAQWTSVVAPPASPQVPAPHADSRDLILDSAGNLLEADDGGIYRLNTPLLAGRSWTNLMSGGASQDRPLRISEFLSIAYDPLNNILFGGLQDNGIVEQQSIASNRVDDASGNPAATDSEVDDASERFVWPQIIVGVTPGDGNSVLAVPMSTDADAAAESVLRFTASQNVSRLAHRLFDTNGNLVAGSSQRALLQRQSAELRFSANSVTNLLTTLDEHGTPVAHGFVAGEGPFRVYNTGGTLPGGLLEDRDYFIVPGATPTTLQLRLGSPTGALVILTGPGSGTQILHRPFTGTRLVANFSAAGPNDTYTAVDAAGNPVVHGLAVGDGPFLLRNSGGSLPGTTFAHSEYFVVAVPTPTTLQLSIGSPGGAADTFTSAGVGVHTLAPHFTGLRAVDRPFLTGFKVFPYVVNAIPSESNRMLLGLFEIYESSDRFESIARAAAIDNQHAFSALAYGGTKDGQARWEVIYAAADNQVFIRLPAAPGSPNVQPFKTEKIDGARQIRDIVLDPRDYEIAYAATDVGVFKRVAPGSWKLISQNLFNANLQTIEFVPKEQLRDPDGDVAHDVLLVGGALGVARAFDPAPNVSWTQFGTNLPNALVADLDFTLIDPTAFDGRRAINDADLLVVGTQGRGGWTLSGADAALAEKAVLKVTGDSTAADEFLVRRNAQNEALVDVVVGGTTIVTAPLLSLDRIEFDGDGGTDTLTVDSTRGPFTLPGGIVFHGGAGNDTVILKGAQVLEKKQTDAGSQRTITVRDTRGAKPQTVVFQDFVSGADTVDTSLLAEASKPFWLKRFFIAIFDFFHDLFTRDPGSGAQLELAVLRGTLPRAISGIDVEEITPISDPDAQGSTEEEETGGQAENPGLARIFEQGENGFSIFDIGEGIPTIPALVDALKALAGDANVTWNGSEDLPEIGLTLAKRLDGAADVDMDFSALGGTGSLSGLVELGANVQLSLTFGIDSEGVFLKTDGAVPELLIDDIEVEGQLEAAGRIGFLDVELKNAQLEVAHAPGAGNGVAVSLNLTAPGGGNKLRLGDLLDPSAFGDIASFDVDGPSGVDDVVFTADLEAKALLPGLDEPFDLGGAGVELRWADIAHPDQVQASLHGGITDFLKVNVDELLNQLRSLRDQVSVFELDLPLVKGGLDQLIQLVETFDTKIIEPLTDGFSGGASFPSIQDLVGSVTHRLGTDLKDANLGFDAAQHLLTYDLSLSSGFQGSMPLDLNFDSPTGLAAVEFSTNATASAAATLDLTLGIDFSKLSLGDPTSIADAVFIQNTSTTGSFSLAATAIAASARLGFLGVNVVNGRGGTGAAGDGAEPVTFSISLEDPDGSATDADKSRISLRELVRALTSDPSVLIGTPQLSGTASLSLPLAAPFLEITASDATTVGVTIDFSKLISDPDEAIQVTTPPTPDLGEMLNFDNMSAAGFASLLGRISNFLDNIRDTRFSGLEIPFTDVSVGDLLDFKDAFADFLLFDNGDSNARENETLIGDINAALSAAGLGGKIRAETRNGNQITLVAEDLSVKLFEVRAAAGAGILGLDTPGSPLSSATDTDNDGIREISFAGVAVNDLLYKLTGGDAAFEVRIDGGDWVAVTVKKSDAASNTELGRAEARLLFGNNAATFVTAQDMAARLNAMLGLPLIYDASTQELYFDLVLDETLFQGSVPLNFDLDLSPLAEVSTDTTIRLRADADLSLRIGVSLGEAQASTLLKTDTLLTALNSGDGAEIKTAPTVFGDNAVRTSTWHLSSDAHFKLFVNSDPVRNITVAKTATLLNVSEADLQVDLNAQLAGSGISAVILDSRIKFIAGAGVTDFRIEAATTDTAIKELGLGTGQKAQNVAVTASSSGGFKLAVDPNDDDKTAEFAITIDGSETTVSVRQRDTADNTSRAHLVADVNDALVRAGLGGKIYAELDGSAIKLIAVDDKVLDFTLSTAATDPAATELGFSATADAEAAGAKTLVANKDLRASVGRFGADLSFDVKIGSDPAVTVNVIGVDGQTLDGEHNPIFTGVDTSTNNSIFDLAADINRALRNAGLQLALVDGQIPAASKLQVEAVGDRLLFTGGTGISSFTLTPTAAAASALGLKSPSEASDRYDLAITTHDGSMSFVTLDGATDVGHVIEKIVQFTDGTDFALNRSDPTVIAGLSFGKVRVEFDDTRTGLKFVDTTSGTGEFMIVPLNGSLAALDLRIVGREGLEDVDGDGLVNASDGYGIIEGGQIAGVTLLDRFFLDNAVISADLLITSEPDPDTNPAAEGISASATFGDFVTISLDGGGTLNARVEAGLKNPVSGELGGKVTLTQLIQGISNPSSIIQTPTFSAGGSLDLGVSVDPDLPGLIGLGTLPRLSITVEDFGNPFAASAASKALGEFTLGAGSSFQIKLNVPGLGEKIVTVSPSGLATTATELEAELSAALQSALAAQVGAGYANLVSANIVTSGTQPKLVLTALEGSGVEGFSIANALGGASSILGFDSNIFGFVDAVTGKLTNQLGNLVPDVDFDFQDLGDLLKFDNINFNFSAILDALIALSDFLDQFESFEFLNEDLPLLNMSVNDVLDFADKLDAAITEAQANPAGAIQQLDAKLKQALGITSGASLLSLDKSGADGIAGNADDDDLLKLTLNLETSFSKSVDIAIPEINIPVIGEALDLGGSANLGVTGSIDARLHLGISLDDPTDVFIYNTTGLFGNLAASGTGLNFRAALGPLGIFIKEGTANASGLIRAGVDLDNDGDVDDGSGSVKRMLLSTLVDDLGNLVEFDVDGSINVNLPAFFPTNTAAQGAFAVNIESGTDWRTLNLADHITLPTFSADAFTSLGLFDSILLAVDGFDMFLGGLQDVMDGEVFAFELPFIGDKLSAGADFIQDFRDGFFADFRDLIQTTTDMADNFTDAELNVISRLLFKLLGPNAGGLNLLKPLNAVSGNADVKNPGAGIAGGSVDDYIRLTTDESGYVQWDFSIGGTAGNGTEVDFDFGIPGLGIEAEGGIGVEFDWDLDLGFGLSLDEGFYLNVADPNELAINVEATLPSSLTGRLAFLQLAAVEKNVIGTDADGNTRLGLAFVVDINNKTNPSDQRLGLAEFGKLGFDAKVAAEAVAELGLTLGLNNDLLNLPASTAAGFPEITADFVFDWGIGTYNYANFESSGFIDIGTVGNAIKQGLRLVEFRDVSLDVGSFLSDVVGPIVEKVQDITQPLQPLIDILTAPLPVISDLGPPLTLLDIAAATGAVDARMIYAIADVISLINRIPDPDEAGALLINLGNFTIVGGAAGLTTDITNPNFKFGTIGSGGALDNLLGSNSKNNLNFDALLAGAAGSSASKKTMQDLKGGNAGGGFSFPIFNDPSQIFGVLMGQEATLVAYDMAPLAFDFEWSTFFPIFGPLGVSINIEFAADIDFDFGYDTVGIRQFVDGGFQNSLALLNGFFVGDLIEGVDVPEVELFGSLWGAAELNLGIARGGVGGGITAEIDLNLNDPDEDGKVRIMEIIGNIENQLNAPSDAEKLLAPLAMFDVSGRIFAELFAFLKINLPWPLPDINKKFNITPPITLIDFDLDFFRPPKLATELDNGDLILNMGKFAGDRLQDPREDVAEHFVLRFTDANTVMVSATNLGSDAEAEQEYRVTGKVIAVTGVGDDKITVVAGAATTVGFDIEGGAGDDIFDLGLVGGNVHVHGDDGIDRITTGSGQDIIYGGRGNDILNAGGGFDIVFGDEDGAITGSNVLVEVSAADGDDTIDGQGDSDILFGGGGIDAVSGGDAADIVIGDGGLVITTAILADIGSWSVTNTERGTLGGNDTLLGNAGPDRLFGGTGNDKLDGGADADQVFAQAGNDIAYGGSGADFVYGAEGNDIVYGKRGSAGGFLGDTDDTADDGDDEVRADDGNDEIHGDDGADTMWGGTGADIMYGDADADHLFGNSDPDELFGGAGEDYLEGGLGNDVVFGGDDSDLLVAGYGSDTLDGEGGGDFYHITVRGGSTTELTTAYDSGGEEADGTDSVVIDGTADADTFLLRAMAAPNPPVSPLPPNDDPNSQEYQDWLDAYNSFLENKAFVALLNNGGASVERFNYWHTEGLVLNTLGGDDYVVSDDVIAATTINLGLGNDRVQVGQMFKSQRDDNPATANIADDDVFATIETTRGWLSNGVSIGTTINGGSGNDDFTVFHNVGDLFLNGGDDDDFFTVRSFALAGSTDSQRGRTDMKGDAGADTILYAINAPVGIDGGDGFDTVRVIGTEFSDDYVVTDAGVFGGGLNVSYVNIEKLIVDGAEGDDRYFVLSTGIGVVTEIDGGLGSDTFFMGGTPGGAPIAVISDDLRGHSGIILHNVESQDLLYDDMTVDGLSANVVDNDESAIMVLESGGVSRVTEGATSGGEGWQYDTYSLRLSRAPSALRPVTISPVVAGLPPEDQARGFADLEFWNGSAWVSKAPVVTFTSLNWNTPQTIQFRAVNDGASEGTSYTVISHKIRSRDASFATAKMRSVKVLMEDDDRAGVIVTPVGDGNPLIEGGRTATYNVVLTRAPSANVDVNLQSINGQVSLSASTLHFTPGNYNVAQHVTITAADDLVREGFHTDFIKVTAISTDVTQQVAQAKYQVDGDFDLPGVQTISADKSTSTVYLKHKPVAGTLAVWVDSTPLQTSEFSVDGTTLTFLDSNGKAMLRTGLVEASYNYNELGYDNVDEQRIALDIYDNEVGQVVLLQTDGSTDVMEGGITDTYQVALSRQPTADVKVTINAANTRTSHGKATYFQKQVEVSLDDVHYSSSVAVTFTTGNWNTPRTIYVRAINDSVVDGNDTQVFAPQAATVNKIRGPILIEGASGSGSMSLPDPLLLPGELNVHTSDGFVASFTAGAGFGAIEHMTVNSADLGAVLARLGLSNVSELAGNTLQLTSGPGTGLVLDSSHPHDLYDRFWLIKAAVNLGSGLTELTLQNPTQIDASFVAAPTSSSKYTINALSVNFFADEKTQVDFVMVFDQDSVADDAGALTSAQIGGRVKGRITGFGMGPDTPIGGALRPGGITYGDIETLLINLGSGNDNVTVDYTSYAPDHFTDHPSFSTITMLNTGMGNDAVTVSLETGHDGAFALNTEAGNDTVNAGASTLPLVIFGGDGADTIAGGSSDDIIFGDIGRVDYRDDTGLIVTRLGQLEMPGTVNPPVTSATAATLTDSSASFTTEYGGLTGLIVQAIDKDGNVQYRRITSNTATQLTVDAPWDVIPDNTYFYRVATMPEDQTDGVVRGPRVAWSINNEIGGIDTITGGSGNDMIIGGEGVDTINGGANNDWIAGDNARFDFEPVAGNDGPTRIKSIKTTGLDVGSGDTISGDAGADIVVGGKGGDSIYGDNAGASNGASDLADVIIGDNGQVDFFNGAIASFFTTDTVETTGGADTIHGNAANDIILGGVNGSLDELFGDGGDDILLGDNGELIYNDAIDPDLTTLDFVRTLDVSRGGADTIHGNAGRDLIFGGKDGDTIDGGSEDDLIFGDFAETKLLLNQFNVVKTLDPTQGGGDVISGNEHDDVLVGGALGDTIDGDAGDDLIFGDAAQLLWRLTDITDPRFETLAGTQIYSTAATNSSGGDLVDGVARNYRDPNGTGAPSWAHWQIQDLRHTVALEAAPDNSFGNDYIAGGSDHDVIFGQLGNDTIQGDGAIEGATVGAFRTPGGASDPLGPLTIMPSFEASTDGDDYIEGNGGNDVVFGGLGQDDIIGGSSDLFTLNTPTRRPDGSDLIFGGAGTHAGRNDLGTLASVLANQLHARDADTIIGDNGDIFRLVGVSHVAAGGFLTFNYDQNSTSQPFEDRGTLRLIPRAVRQLDYTPGGPDFTPAVEAGPTDVAINPGTGVRDIGGADEVHGEGGDDVVYTGLGRDVLFGDAQDDNMVGGYGTDWISGGAGDDGILGDDGRIFVSRNSTSFGEPLYGIAAIPAGQINALISNSSGMTFAVTNVSGALKYTVDLTPYSVDSTNAAPSTLMPRALYANDMIYGGLGNDSLHGGAGEDAISGGEAMATSYVNNYAQNGTKLNGAPVQSDFAHPVNPGNVLGYNPTTTKFALYDANDPLRKILLNAATGALSKTGSGLEWALNFTESDGPIDTAWIVGTSYSGVNTDGNDHVFGDLGHDWLVGGTGRDTLWGGWGDDQLQADDKLSTNGGLNSGPDTNPSWEDFAYGGAGRDVLIGNTGGDRLWDWTGEFNTFVIPYNPFGIPTVERIFQPAMQAFMLALSKSQGADQTLAAQYGSGPARNGEPFGELGMVLQQDAAWNDQNGGPRDPQGPNAQAKRDVNPSAGVQPLFELAADFVTGTVDASALLSDAQLAPIVAEARLLWAQVLGAGDSRLARLDGAHVMVGNLPEDRLGVTIGNVILIDSDAAGHGWFIDKTPQDNVEFHFVPDLAEWIADAHSPAFSRIDLLTTVMHELGHVLGFDDHQAQQHSANLMTETLSAGVRRSLSTERMIAEQPVLSLRQHPAPGAEAFSVKELLGRSLKTFMGAWGSTGTGSVATTKSLTQSVLSPVIDWTEDDSHSEQKKSRVIGASTQKASWLGRFLIDTGREEAKHHDHGIEVVLAKKK